MSDDEFFAELKKGIRQRTLDQMARHQRVNPNIPTSQVVDIQLGQEREKLLKFADKYEDDGKSELAEFCRTLAEDWLPTLRAELLH